MTQRVWLATSSKAFRLVALASACALVAFLGTGCEAKEAAQVQLSEAQTAYDTGQFADAADKLQEIIETDAENWDARRLYGLALSAQGDNEGAIEEYLAVIDAEPEDDVTLYRLALIERLTGQTQDAIGHFEQAVAIKADDSYVDELARTYMQVGKYEQAAKAWGSLLEDEARELESKVALLKLQADAFQAAKDYDSARAALEKAIDLAPNDGDLKVKLEALSQ